MGTQPEDGIVVAANNPVVPAEYTDYLERHVGRGEYDVRISPLAVMGYRAQRITDLLDATDKHDVPTNRTIQTDVRSDVALALVDTLSTFSTPQRDPGGIHVRLYQNARDADKESLPDHDGGLHTGSRYATAMMSHLRALNQVIFGPGLDGLMSPELSMTSLRSLDLQLGSLDGFWESAGGRDQAMGAALKLVHDDYGRDFRSLPPWGELHRANFENPFLGNSGIGMLESAVNRGGIPTPGGPGTVNIGRWSEKRNSYEPTHIAAYRRIIDLGNFDQSVAVNSTGQSGHPYSPHYDDQIALWARGEYRPIHFSREAVESATRYRLLLQPAGG